MPRIGGDGCRLAPIVGRHRERVLRTEMKLLDGESESRRSGAGGHWEAGKLAFSGVPRRERIDMMRALHTTWSFAIVWPTRSIDRPRSVGFPIKKDIFFRSRENQIKNLRWERGLSVGSASEEKKWERRTREPQRLTDLRENSNDISKIQRDLVSHQSDKILSYLDNARIREEDVSLSR